jgi:hypothetical protein
MLVGLGAGIFTNDEGKETVADLSIQGTDCLANKTLAPDASNTCNCKKDGSAITALVQFLLGNIPFQWSS